MSENGEPHHELCDRDARLLGEVGRRGKDPRGIGGEAEDEGAQDLDVVTLECRQQIGDPLAGGVEGLDRIRSAWTNRCCGCSKAARISFSAGTITISSISTPSPAGAPFAESANGFAVLEATDDTLTVNFVRSDFPPMYECTLEKDKA